jgi:hypothetical protein
MCPGDVTRSFEENLRGLPGHKSKKNAIKFILAMSEEERWEALEDLYNLNITRATLFPDLGGFASSLVVSPPKFLLPPDDISYLKC